MSSCDVCGGPGKFRCAKCGSAFYCSADHQRQAWKGHKQVCQGLRSSEPAKGTVPEETSGQSKPSTAAHRSSATSAVPEVLPSGANIAAAVKLQQSPGESQVTFDQGICRYINLERRTDRKTALEALATPHQCLFSALKRLPAVDGRVLDWSNLASSRKFMTEACMQGKMAEKMKQATINIESPEEGSSHLTLGGCGCALSHLNAWNELLSSGKEWALIMEDDVSSLCNDFDAELKSVLGRLPVGWQVCYLGYHTRAGAADSMLPSGKHVQGPCRMPPDGDDWLPGLYCYLISTAGAKSMVQKLLPFQAQVDYVFGCAAIESGQCFALELGNFLAFSKPSEVSMDTDIQTFAKNAR